jgi:cation:H+ antiporter
LVWLKFLICLVIILFAGTKLARYGDAIAEKTGLGRIWIGLFLIALITSMPELVTGISAAALVKLPDLALGDFLGSCLFNLAIIAVLDIIYRPAPVLTKASPSNILLALLGILLIAIAAVGILAGEWLSGFALGWVGVPGIIIFLFYLFSIRQMFYYERRRRTKIRQKPTPLRYEGLSSKTVYLRFALAALAIIGTGIWLAFIGKEIADTYNLSSSFVGSLFLAISTSMPELVVSITAVRLGAIDMAIADVLGANMLNMANIFTADIFYGQGAILSSVSSDHLITAMVAIVMTLLVIIGLRFRQERKTFRFISWYGIALIGLYLIGSYAIYYAGSV